MIRKVVIRNYRKFRSLTVDLTLGTNILVGGNDSGKSILIEAIHLALTGRVNSRAFAQELSPYYVNHAATTEYIGELKANRTAVPPEILIELYLEDGENANLLQGTNNTLNEDSCGVRIWARIDAARFEKEYKAFVAQPNDVTLVPTEYYKVEWLGFSGGGVTARSIPATASMVDPSSLRLQAGVDYHLQQIIQTHLAPNERVEVARQYRSLRSAFAGTSILMIQKHYGHLCHDHAADALAGLGAITLDGCGLKATEHANQQVPLGAVGHVQV